MFFYLKKIIFCSLIFTLLGAPAFSINLEKGEIVPSLNIVDIHDQPIKLSYLFEAKPKIVFFFASWSKSCQKAAAYLNNLYMKNQSQLQIIGISFDQKTEDLQKLIDEQNLKFTLLKDPKLISAKPYQILVIPSIFLIGSDNRLVELIVDFDENIPNKIEESLIPLLK